MAKKRRFCRGVITADSDGQHIIKDVLAIDTAMQENPNALILGVRNFDNENVPPKSRFGNKITRQIMHFLYGGNITDTQTGLRAIPDSILKQYLTLSGERFEFETMMLIETLQKKITIKEVPIETVYINDNKETHFRPVADSLAVYRIIFGVFLKYILSSLSSSLLDLVLFQVLITIASGFEQGTKIWMATITARIFSSLYNYNVNRSIVFSGKGKRTFIRYYILCIIQICCSATWVHGLCRFLKFPELAAKVIVDSILFLASFHLQQIWVFGGKQ